MRILHDVHGEPSTMRIACLGCTGTACAAVLLPMLGYGSPPDFATLAALLGAGVGGKAVQRRQEEQRFRADPGGALPPGAYVQRGGRYVPVSPEDGSRG